MSREPYDVMLNGLGIFVGGVFALAGFHPFFVVMAGVIVLLLGLLWSITSAPEPSETLK